MTHPNPLWIGPPPAKCDVCHEPIQRMFFDCLTDFGPWGCLCPSCHALHGYGIGQGRGQRYERDNNGNYIKTGG